MTTKTIKTAKTKKTTKKVRDPDAKSYSVPLGMCAIVWAKTAAEAKRIVRETLSTTHLVTYPHGEPHRLRFDSLGIGAPWRDPE
jgi:hypothetical protein